MPTLNWWFFCGLQTLATVYFCYQTTISLWNFAYHRDLFNYSFYSLYRFAGLNLSGMGINFLIQAFSKTNRNIHNEQISETQQLLISYFSDIFVMIGWMLSIILHLIFLYLIWICVQVQDVISYNFMSVSLAILTIGISVYIDSFESEQLVAVAAAKSMV
jgi:hypothetical protein